MEERVEGIASHVRRHWMAVVRYATLAVINALPGYLLMALLVMERSDSYLWAVVEVFVWVAPSLFLIVLISGLLAWQQWGRAVAYYERAIAVRIWRRMIQKHK